MLTTTHSPLRPRRPAGPRLQLLIACSLLGLLVVMVGASAIVGIASVRGAASEAVTVDAQLSRLANEVANQALESRRYEKDFFLNVGDRATRAEYLAKWQAASAALDRAIAAFSTAVTTPQDRQQAALWREQAGRYARDFREVAQAAMDGRIATAQAANAAFAPFKENVRALTESSVDIADDKARLAVATSATLEAASARTTWLVGLLIAIALMVVAGYGAADTLPFRRHCVDCDTRLPLRQWLGGEHRCLSCNLCRLARMIDQAEESQRSDPFD